MKTLKERRRIRTEREGRKETVQSQEVTKPALTVHTNTKHPVQMSCTLLGGKINEPVIPPANPNEPEKMVAVVIVKKCPCCKTTFDKKATMITERENNAHYHCFVEQNIPGIIKYETCGKCSKRKLTIVQ